MKAVYLFAVLVVIGVSQCMDIRVKPCTGSETSLADIIHVTVDPCTAEPCKIVEGTNATITIEFKPNNDFKELTTKIHAKLGPLWVNYPVEQSNACKESGLKCPVLKDSDDKYRFSLLVSESYPAINLVLKFELVDENAKDEVCVQFPINVVKSKGWN